MNFNDKVVIITGASSGIGEVTAIKFAKLGAKLSLCGRNRTKLEDLAEKCETLSKLAPVINVGDLTDHNHVEFIIANTIKYFLTIDVLVNSAGVFGIGSYHEASIEQFDNLININIRAAFNLSLLAAPYLVKTKGSIVNVSSMHGLRASPGFLCYNITKAALDHFTRCLATELAPKEVRVNSVNPAFVHTDFCLKGGMEKHQCQSVVENASGTSPLCRLCEPKEVANAITFLACRNLSSYISGVNLCLDGGRPQI